MRYIYEENNSSRKTFVDGLYADRYTRLGVMLNSQVADLRLGLGYNVGMSLSRMVIPTYLRLRDYYRSILES